MERHAAEGGAAQPANSIAHDIFTDPELTKTATEDPLFRLLSKWWKQITVVVLALAAVWYAREKFAETTALRVAEAADLYMAAGSRYQTFVRASHDLLEKQAKLEKAAAADAEALKKEIENLTKQRDQAKTQLLESLNSLSDAQSPYQELGSTYRALLAKAELKTDEAIQQLGQGESPTATNRPLTTQMELLVVELRRLARARLLIDQDTHLSEGRALLKELASKGLFVNVGAALTLSRISKTPEEKREADEVVKALEAAHPEQAEELKQQIGRLSH